MPTFDIVSQVDWQEVTNAVNQSNKEISTRFDFKGSDAGVEAARPRLTVHADDDFKVAQIEDILQLKLSKRGVDTNSLDKSPVRVSPTGKAVQEITVREGIDTDTARQIVKLIKNQKLKVQTAIQTQQLRVSGKKRDDLQQVIAFLKTQKLSLPLQFVNFRD